MLLEDAEEAGNQSSRPDLEKIRSAARQLLELINTRLAPGPAQGNPGPQGNPAPGMEGTKRPPRIFHGRVLAVDDNPGNLDVLARRLERHGLEVETCPSGLGALDLIHAGAYDLVLLDVVMPGLDGPTVLREIKSSPKTRDIPVIMVSALDELESVVRCIDAGAEDYLPKPFNPTLLEARIGACLEKKALRDAERGHLKKIEETQLRLDKELADAAAYVRSILPPPIDGPLKVEWKYRPSSELAGDSFGYHWIGPGHFAIYLLDVCGHGVGPCLLSVAAINALRSGSLPGVDFRDPGAVLAALNNAFPMERQNDLYFTLWYGVYDAPARTLAYSSAGHPPALLLAPDANGGFQSTRLGSPGMAIGMMEGTIFPVQKHAVPAGAKLFVVCDGCYEIKDVNGAMGGFGAFEEFLLAHAGSAHPLGDLENRALEIQGSANLDDDFSVIEVRFPQ